MSYDSSFLKQLSSSRCSSIISSSPGYPAIDYDILIYWDVGSNQAPTGDVSGFEIEVSFYFYSCFISKHVISI